MKRVALSLIFVLFGLFLFCQSAGAYYINDTYPPGPYIPVTVWRNGTPYFSNGSPAQADEIDTTSGIEWYQSNYQTFGIDYVQVPDDDYLTIQIYTNYPSAGLADAWNTIPGDFGIDVANDGFCEYAVPLYGHDGLTVGGLYNVNNWRSADSYRPAGSAAFYGDGNVTASTNGLAGMESVLWNTIGGYPNYRIDIVLDVRDFLPVGFDGDIGIYWSTATCANDLIRGTIPVTYTNTPEPGTWVMLGCGLIGLAAFRTKKRII